MRQGKMFTAVAPKPGVIERRPERPQTGLDIPEALAVGQLGKREGQELIAAGESSRTLVSAVAANAVGKLALREIVEELAEDGGSGKHRQVS